MYTDKGSIDFADLKNNIIFILLAIMVNRVYIHHIILYSKSVGIYVEN